MQDASSTPLLSETFGELAAGVLTDLYRAVSGHAPKAVRAYREDDALLLLLRFDPAELSRESTDGLETLLETAFIAMPGMIAAALEGRSSHRMTPGHLSVSADRGLAVFAFDTVTEEPESIADADLFQFEVARPAARLAG